MVSAHAKSLPADDLIAKNICPVKKEYVKGDLPRQTVDEVRTSAGKGVAGKGKHRSKEKRESTIPGKDGLCFHFTRSNCSFGDRCKFSHDMLKYLGHRPPDLPGRCPFESLQECPYQVTCRWASTHRNPDALTTKWLFPHLRQASGAKHSDRAVVDSAKSMQSCAPAQDTAVSQAQVIEGGNVLSDQGTARCEAGTAGVQEGGEQPPESTIPSAGEAVKDAHRPTDLSTAIATEVTAATSLPNSANASDKAAAVPPDTLLLPVADAIQQPRNHLNHTLVHDLRKYRYHFDRADEQLSVLGLSNNLQARDKLPKNKRKQPAATAPPAVKLAESGADASRGGGAGISASDAAPAAPAEASTEGKQASDGVINTATEEGKPWNNAAATAEVANFPPVTAATTASSAIDAPDSRGSTAIPRQAAKKQCVGDGASPIPIYDVSRTSNLDGGLQQRDGKPYLDFRGKLYCAPLTTNGNLPFRRIVKNYGCDITCGEMALTANLLQGQQSEWALLKRHPSEDIFGVQICGGHPDSVARCVQLLDDNIDADFIDINMGCPIDLVCNKGMGAAMLTKPKRMEHVVRAAAAVAQRSVITFKTRTGYQDKDAQRCAAEILAGCGDWGAAAVTLHGRTRNQRYSRLADWKYIEDCSVGMPDNVQLIGNGDVFSWEEYAQHMRGNRVATCMIARAALIKPWIFTEIKEERHWDISAGERLDMLKNYCSWGLQHWGSDSKGVETTRRFLLEWLSFLCRYVPVGLMEVVPQQMTWRPPSYVGRNDLETLMASSSAQDWVRISEMLLGPVPPGFVFVPKHKSNAYVDSRDEEVQG